MGHTAGELFGYANDELADTIFNQSLKVGVMSCMDSCDPAVVTNAVVTVERVYYRASPDTTLGHKNTVTLKCEYQGKELDLSLLVSKDLAIVGGEFCWRPKGGHRSFVTIGTSNVSSSRLETGTFKVFYNSESIIISVTQDLIDLMHENFK